MKKEQDIINLPFVCHIFQVDWTIIQRFFFIMAYKCICKDGTQRRKMATPLTCL